ncbi:MAG: response regulator [Sandaracinaceae bacterium]|nr:response regulator [Sandaracinaceae bacterium]
MRSPSAHRALVGAVAAFVLSATPVALASWLLHSQQHEAANEETRMLSEQAALRLADFARSRFLAVEIVRREIQEPGLAAEARFDSLAAATEAEYSGFAAINWVDGEGVIQRVFPREPNLAALGRSVLSYPPSHAAAQEALRTGEPRATPPLDLMQGGRGFATYFPVSRGGVLRGAINGVFRIDDLVRGCLRPSLLERYVVVIEDRGQPVYGDPSELLPGTTPHAVQVLDREWSLRLSRRSDSTGGDVARWSFTAVGLGFAIALALVVFLAARRQELHLAAEREHRRLELQLNRAQRLEGLGRLAGVVAHDFNNLLSVILTATEYALSRGEVLGPAREPLEDARTAAERAAGLVRQLRAFSREQPRDVQRLDLAEVVRTTERLLRRTIEGDVELVVRAPDAPVWVMSDPTQLTQVLMNLVTNASDALGGRGRIDLELSVREGDGPDEPSGRWAVLEVRDDGPGIAAADLEHVLEPFYTTKGPTGGTGLGLATVQEVLQQHEGHVTVESAVGRGATFRAFFPLAPDAAPPSAERVEPERVEPETAREPERALVLVVDDQELVRRSTRRILEGSGHRVVLAEDGVAALEQLDAGVAPDLVLTDLVMPRMGGLDLLRELRRREERMPVLLVSGFADQRIDADELATLGARFLAKPHRADALVALVAELLEAVDAKRA